MSQKVRIGYMGIPYSNTWQKAKEFSDELGWEAELIGLMSARNTVEAMEKGEVDYGVLAYSNNIAGTVGETAEAMKGRIFEVLAKGPLPIHHCVFAKSPDCSITGISSHIHALKQCVRSLGKLYPDAIQMESPDTAYSAQMLAEGKLSDSVAVLCTRPAGEHWGLTLIHENIEDRKDNITQFVLLRVPRPSPDIPEA